MFILLVGPTALSFGYDFFCWCIFLGHPVESDSYDFRHLCEAEKHERVGKLVDGDVLPKVST